MCPSEESGSLGSGGSSLSLWITSLGFTTSSPSSFCTCNGQRKDGHSASAPRILGSVPRPPYSTVPQLTIPVAHWPFTRKKSFSTGNVSGSHPSKNNQKFASDIQLSSTVYLKKMAQLLYVYVTWPWWVGWWKQLCTLSRGNWLREG